MWVRLPTGTPVRWLRKQQGRTQAFWRKWHFFKTPCISTRQTERTRARTHKPRPPIGCSRRALSGVAKKTQEAVEIKNELFPAKQQEPWNPKEPCFAFHTGKHPRSREVRRRGAPRATRCSPTPPRQKAYDAGFFPSMSDGAFIKPISHKNFDEWPTGRPAGDAGRGGVALHTSKAQPNKGATAMCGICRITRTSQGAPGFYLRGCRIFAQPA